MTDFSSVIANPLLFCVTGSRVTLYCQNRKPYGYLGGFLMLKNNHEKQENKSWGGGHLYKHTWTYWRSKMWKVLQEGKAQVFVCTRAASVFLSLTRRRALMLLMDGWSCCCCCRGQTPAQHRQQSVLLHKLIISISGAEPQKKYDFSCKRHSSCESELYSWCLKTNISCWCKNDRPHLELGVFLMVFLQVWND